MLYYSKTCLALCQGVLTHPDTGERYGGSDYVNDAKLTELDAVPVVEVDSGSGPVLDSTVVSLNEDGEGATLTRTWREKNETEIAADTKTALAVSDAKSARKAEDVWTLLLAKGLISAEDVPEPVRSWIDERIALRADL